MRNTKGGIGDFLIFVVIAILVAFFVWFIFITGNKVATDTLFKEDASAVTLIADGIVNTPNCMLAYEKENIAGTDVLVAHRGIVDWEHAKNAKPDCVKKRPYVWNAVLTDDLELKKELEAMHLSDVNAVIDKVKSILPLTPLGRIVKGLLDITQNEFNRVIASFSRNAVQITNIPSGCKTISSVSTPVLIKRDGEYHKGTLLVAIAKIDNKCGGAQHSNAISLARLGRMLII